MKAQFYYEWGNEPKGFVSIGKWSKKGLFVNLGYLPKTKIGTLPFECPFS